MDDMDGLKWVWVVVMLGVLVLGGCVARVERFGADGRVVERIMVPWPQSWRGDRDAIEPGEGTVAAAAALGGEALKIAPDVAGRVAEKYAERLPEGQR